MVQNEDLQLKPDGCVMPLHKFLRGQKLARQLHLPLAVLKAGRFLYANTVVPPTLPKGIGEFGELRTSRPVIPSVKGLFWQVSFLAHAPEFR